MPRHVPYHRRTLVVALGKPDASVTFGFLAETYVNTKQALYIT